MQCGGQQKTTCPSQQQQQEPEQKVKVSYETVKSSTEETSGYYIEQHFTGCLAQYAYYIESNGEAAICDPMREIDQYLSILQQRKTTLKYVLCTHFHADFVCGHYDLALATGAQVIFGPSAESALDIIVAKDNEDFKLGKITIRVLHTPGHTPESSSFLLIDENGKQKSVLSGDTIFLGDVGRPDLAVSIGVTKEELASWLFDSTRNKLMTLPDEIIVYPGHGAGSACGKNIQSGNFCTIGKQKLTNYALAVDLTKADFVKLVTADIPVAPKYFPMNAQMNKQGYTNIFDLVKKSTTPMTLEQFQTEITNGAIVIDCRKIVDYLNTGIIPNSVCLTYQFPIATWLGILMDDKHSFVLLTDKESEKEKEIATRFARVGFENLLGYLDGGIETWIKAGQPLEKIEYIEISQLKSLQGKLPIIDVRKTVEYNRVHLDGTINAVLGPSFLEEFKKIPNDKDILMHCKSGARSICAISMLRRQGYKNKMIDIKGGIDQMEKDAIDLVK